MQSNQDMRALVETMTDVPDSELEQVVRDYRASGAEITQSRQSNGKWKLIARFIRGTSYPASGQPVL
jgi:muconolactone delta-isomerase